MLWESLKVLDIMCVICTELFDKFWFFEVGGIFPVVNSHETCKDIL
jgi:hypothetical protein